MAPLFLWSRSATTHDDHGEHHIDHFNHDFDHDHLEPERESAEER